jgi:hypothetical protein
MRAVAQSGRALEKTSGQRLGLADAVVERRGWASHHNLAAMHTSRNGSAAISPKQRRLLRPTVFTAGA